jgi:hypothetical protein
MLFHSNSQGGDHTMDINPLDLLRAARREDVRFKAWAKDSYRETLVYLKNEGNLEFQIDVSRSGLTAKISKSQPIGLCYPVKSIPGDHILILRSGQEKEIVFSSRCLDKRGDPPNDGVEYALIPDLLADYVVNLLRQGSDQGEVWETISNRKGEITVRSAIPAMVDKF